MSSLSIGGDRERQRPQEQLETGRLIIIYLGTTPSCTQDSKLTLCRLEETYGVRRMATTFPITPKQEDFGGHMPTPPFSL